MRPRHHYVAGLRRYVLAAAAQARVFYRHAGRGISFQVWHCGSLDHDQVHGCTYTTMTPQVAWLIDQRLARIERGYRMGRGEVALTPSGWEEVARLVAGFWEALAGARW